MKDKKGVRIDNAFKKILDSSENNLHSNRKPNKIWVDHGSEFYNNILKKFFKKNEIEMYSTFDGGKSVVAERFIKTFKNKIYRHMTTVCENVYFNVLDNIVKKYNGSYHKTIKMKPKDVTDKSFIEYNEESNKIGPKFKVGDHVRISRFKNIFSKDFTPNWSEEIFVIKKIKKPRLIRRNLG